MGGRRGWSAADNAADETLLLHSENEFEVHFGVDDGCEAEAGFGDIVEVRVHVHKIGERHDGSESGRDLVVLKRLCFDGVDDGRI